MPLSGLIGDSLVGHAWFVIFATLKKRSVPTHYDSRIKEQTMWSFKLLLSVALGIMLLGCGGGGSGSGGVIGISDENTSASIGSDLSLTVRVDPGESSGFTTRVGPDGARITLNSGQRIEISADRPAALQLESNGASVNILATNGTVWSGELSSPVQTSLRFRFSALDRPDRNTTLTVDINP
jgi:hypothetical protein